MVSIVDIANACNAGADGPGKTILLPPRRTEKRRSASFTVNLKCSVLHFPQPSLSSLQMLMRPMKLQFDTLFEILGAISLPTILDKLSQSSSTRNTLIP